jgi:hypothetical protein
MIPKHWDSSGKYEDTSSVSFQAWREEHMPRVPSNMEMLLRLDSPRLGLHYTINHMIAVAGAQPHHNFPSGRLTMLDLIRDQEDSMTSEVTSP